MFGNVLDVKVGDMVALLRNGNIEGLRRVERLTAKQVILKHPGNGEINWRFWKENGGEVGTPGVWDHRCIVPVTPDITRNMKRSAAINALQKVNWSTFTDDRLDSVMSIVFEQRRESAPSVDAVDPSAGI